MYEVKKVVMQVKRVELLNQLVLITRLLRQGDLPVKEGVEIYNEMVDKLNSLR